MTGKELQAHFKSANWGSPKGVATFVAAVGEVGSPDLLKLLSMLTAKKLQADAKRHELRCDAFVKLAAQTEDKELFAPFLSALKGADPKTRNVLVALIPQVNNVHKHKALCSLLKSPDAALRQQVAQVMKQIGGKTVLHTLQELVLTHGFRGRVEAANVAVEIAGHYGIGLLRDVLDVGDPVEKLAVLELLANRKYMERDLAGAREAIASVLDDRNDKVVVQAIACFAEVCEEEHYFDSVERFLEDPDLARVKAAVAGLKHFSSPRICEAMEQAFRTGPDVVRMLVLENLEVNGSDDMLPLLVEALSYPKVTIRTRAAEVFTLLSKEGKFDPSATILWLLRSTDPAVRRMAAEVVATVHDPHNRLWPKLLSFLKDADWWVRERVTDGLVRIAGGQLTRYLVGFLTEPSDVVRRFAVDKLGRLGDPQALGALVRTAQGDPDWWVKERAVEAMAELGDAQAVPYLIDLLGRDPGLRLSIVEALQALEARDAAPHVAALLTDDDVDLRCAALGLLDHFDAREQANLVDPLLQDPDEVVRKAARALLTRWERNVGEQHVQQADITTSMLDELLGAVARINGSDLLIAPDRKVYVKRLGALIPLGETPLSGAEVSALLVPQLHAAQLEALAERREIDFSYELAAEQLRFRVNVYQEQSGISAVFRLVQGMLPDLDALGLPPVVASFADLSHGLVLVGGAVGSGKTTTLAALIDRINSRTAHHVISLEDPIEIVHKPKRSVITQREVGANTVSFPSGLRAALRQDPDVILVGEMRDLETISFAVTAAETGHLVFGTLHTVSAYTSVDRIINAFPAGEQDHVRSTLSHTLKAVICQHLLRHTDGLTRCLAVEVMLNNDAVSNLIRMGKIFQIPSVMATSTDIGMQLMDNELMKLIKAGLVDPEEAYMRANNKKDFEELVFGEQPDESAVLPGQSTGAGAGPGEDQSSGAVAGSVPAAKATRS